VENIGKDAEKGEFDESEYEQVIMCINENRQ
jgi:hypothetical protein